MHRHGIMRVSKNMWALSFLVLNSRGGYESFGNLGLSLLSTAGGAGGTRWAEFR